MLNSCFHFHFTMVKMDYRHIFFIVVLIKKVLGSGQVLLEMISYSNEDGTGDNGNCCDTLSYWCMNTYCDHRFDICVDVPSGDGDVANCAYGKVSTGSIDNENVITFGTDIAGTPNPIVINFNRWIGDGVRIKIDVYDADGSKADFVQYYNQKITVMPAASIDDVRLKHVTFSGRTTLETQLYVFCDENYYGADCSIHCVPNTDDYIGHYDCNQDDGSRVCHQGWEGVNCNIDIDECGSSPCQNGGMCIDGNNLFECRCTPQYTGPTCQEAVDFCLSAPCENGGTCDRTLGGYVCTCPLGYAGTTCADDVDDCASSPCHHSATCEDGVGTFTCHCRHGYSGVLCDVNINECASQPCHHGGQCVDGTGDYSCQCIHGYTGSQCETEVNECATSPCGLHGQCTDLLGGYTCRCRSGWSGDRCDVVVSPCDAVPCHNGGTCRRTRGDSDKDYRCECVPGYTGYDCDVNVDECDSAPCQNGGHCVDDVNGYSCTCLQGWAGEHCTENIDECTSVPCQHGATCQDGVASFTCNCTDGWLGPVCAIEVDPCDSQPCLNNATCSRSGRDYRCICLPGYTGTDCDVNIDECSINEPCANNGTCVDLEPGYTCNCPAEWTGSECEQEVDPCLIGPCNSQATCIRTYPGFQCECPDFYTGHTCDVIIDGCQSNPCQHGDECWNNFNGTFRCHCMPGFEGDLCENETDECIGEPCENGGSCIDKVAGFECVCPEGFGGTTCSNIVTSTSTESRGVASTAEPTTKIQRKQPTRMLPPDDVPDRPCAMMFQGKVGVYEMGIFMEGLKNRTATSIAVNVSVMQESHTLRYCEDIDGNPVTVLEFSITNSDDVIPWHYFEKLFYKDLSQKEQRGILPRPLYTDGDCFSTGGEQILPQASTGKSFLDRQWVLLVACGTVLLIVLIVLVAALLMTKQKKKDPPFHVAQNPMYDARPSVISVGSANSYTGTTCRDTQPFFGPPDTQQLFYNSTYAEPEY